MLHVAREPITGTVSQDIRAATIPEGALVLWWLGQAGFAFRCGGLTGLIDPYLSDHLAQKYRNTSKPHDRLIRPPIALDDLPRVDIVFCSHAHSDHMDPETLPAIAAANRRCQFVIPASCIERAKALPLPEEQLIPLDAGNSIDLFAELRVVALPSAHEELEVDDAGRQRYLGYVLKFPAIKLYHSGDCAPYAGLADRLRAQSPDIALLPVNGRDSQRRLLGIAGNFTIREATTLCHGADIPFFIPHHFGMFALNTVPLAEIEKQIACAIPQVNYILPDTESRIVVTRFSGGAR